RLFVRNLAFETTEEELEKYFSACGRLVECHIPVDDQKRNKGYAFISFESAVDAMEATNQLDKVDFQGRLLHILQAPESRSLSMGYGFVELASHELAKKAIKMLQGKLIDGHSLQLAISSSPDQKSSRSKATTATGKKPPTKIMVKNVPFQATRTELLKLFGTFGQLKKVRLPKKFDGSHRGFAFIEFLTGKEALTAMNALSRTHLYGRHLVL
ncbi:RNA-binding domain-containing protein, partial [Fragilariopsis cylindrus CCMP1102]